MKILILVRHAKSSHSFDVSSDFDRPLNDRGFREASEMGKKLLKKNKTNKIHALTSLFPVLPCAQKQRRNYL